MKRESYHMVTLIFTDQFQREYERDFQVLAFNNSDAKKRARRLNVKGLIFKLKTVR